MKRRTVIMGIGGLLAALGYFSVATLIVTIFESYESKAKRYYSADRRVTDMQSLYLLVESKSPADLGLIKLDGSAVGSLNFPSSWRIPQKLIPTSLNRSRTQDDSAYARLGDILAHYDEKEKFIAVEFFGSRYGCFIHRDPAMIIPRNFKSQIPIRTSSPLVTAWSEDE